jgi:hypothetical protein
MRVIAFHDIRWTHESRRSGKKNKDRMQANQPNLDMTGKTGTRGIPPSSNATSEEKMEQPMLTGVVRKDGRSASDSEILQRVLAETGMHLNS